RHPARRAGPALAMLAKPAPELFIVNLETSITTSADWEPKGINYRMHPANVGCLTAAGIDCCVLANNHVLDWGREGLRETLAALDAAVPGEVGRDGRVPVAAVDHGSAGSGCARDLAVDEGDQGFAAADVEAARGVGEVVLYIESARWQRRNRPWSSPDEGLRAECNAGMARRRGSRGGHRLFPDRQHPLSVSPAPLAGPAPHAGRRSARVRAPGCRRSRARCGARWQGRDHCRAPFRRGECRVPAPLRPVPR